MKRRKRLRLYAPQLPESELDLLLLKIGRQIKYHRQAKSTLDNFSFEINVSKTTIIRLEAGGDVLLSSLLKILHGLNITLEDIFKEIK